MIKLWLIRHGKTEGNKLSRYIGTTDEPLCQEGTEFLHKMDYPKVQAVYVSPLKRCVQTAEILFPGEPVHIIEELAECDFGEFENKNYKELEGNPHYQEWIDSNGTLPFPGGESREGFKSRNLRGFDRVVSGCIRSHVAEAALVIHGCGSHSEQNLQNTICRKILSCQIQGILHLCKDLILPYDL